ncbi:hypothetical protein [Sphingomonas hankookensis]|uniref:hypothetical protein n=1 Tax=Sphingomonas hankookensis TaxID=563996 RepID=UPI003D3027B0
MIRRIRAAVAAFRNPTPVPASSLDFAFGGTVWPGLAKLAEESNEVGQVLAKLIQTGGDSQHWSGDLVEMLVEELPDLLAAYHVFFCLNPVLHPHAAAMNDRALAKTRQFFAWHYDTLAERKA